MFGVPTVDLGAEATAEVSPANAMTCVKPFTIPDKWEEKQTPPWDPSDTFDAFDNKGKPLANPDIYIPLGQPGYTGYNAETDKGTLITLKAGTGNNITPSFYYPFAIADVMRTQVARCFRGRAVRRRLDDIVRQHVMRGG